MGFLKKGPRRPDPPRPAIHEHPCPRCKGPLEVLMTPDGRPYLADSGVRHVAAIPVLCCRSCRRLAAHVEGIADEWRDDGPGLVDRLIRDAEDALRTRRFLDAEPGDPMCTTFPLG